MSPGCGASPLTNVTTGLESVKSTPARINKPFWKTIRLAAGLGARLRVNVTFDPSTDPPGVSRSTNVNEPVPLVPQGPLVPSTCTQSPALPAAPSMAPVALITALRETAKLVPAIGLKSNSLWSPVTPEIGIVVGVLSGDRNALVLIRTSCTRS